MYEFKGQLMMDHWEYGFDEWKRLRDFILIGICEQRMDALDAMYKKMRCLQDSLKYACIELTWDDETGFNDAWEERYWESLRARENAYPTPLPKKIPADSV